MSWGDKLQSAIERRDARALRRMAEGARTEQRRMFLNLLADFIHRAAEEGDAVEEAGFSKLTWFAGSSTTTCRIANSGGRRLKTVRDL